MSTTYRAVEAKSLPELAEVLNEEYNCNGFAMVGTWQIVSVEAEVGLRNSYQALIAKTVQMEPTGGERLDRMS